MDMKEKILNWMKANKSTIIIAMCAWFIGVLMGWKAAGFAIFHG